MRAANAALLYWVGKRMKATKKNIRNGKMEYTLKLSYLEYLEICECVSARLAELGNREKEYRDRLKLTGDEYYGKLARNAANEFTDLNTLYCEIKKLDNR